MFYVPFTGIVCEHTKDAYLHSTFGSTTSEGPSAPAIRTSDYRIH